MNEHLREQLEACRPGSDELREPEMTALAEQLARDPELRAQWERIGQFDAAVAEAFDEVPVPPELADRLLTALGAADASNQPSPLDEIPLDEPLLQTATTSPVPRRRSRRWAIVAATAVAASLLVAVGMWLTRTGPSIGSAELVRQSHGWRQEVLQGDAGQWQTDIAAAPRDDYPLPRSVTASAKAWQRVAALDDPSAVAFDLAPRGARRAVLFVIRTRRSTGELPGSPPRSPQSGTGGWQIGVWHSGDVIYVLAVSGDRRQYLDLIRAATTI